MSKSQQPDGGQTRFKRTLIVEDDPLLGNFLLEALQEEAYQAWSVLSGEMALGTLQTDVPALLLLDYHLSGMNGQEYAQTPILLMSADSPQQINGIKHLRTLRKPFELDTLLHIAAELLA